MPSGGARLLAGRRKAAEAKRPRTPHGVKPKKPKTIKAKLPSTKQLEKLYLTAKERGAEMPLDFLLRVMRTTSDLRLGMQAAMTAAPYCHPKYAVIAFRADGQPGDNARDVTEVLDFFASKFGTAGPGSFTRIIEAGPGGVGEAPVSVEGMVGATRPTTSD